MELRNPRTGITIHYHDAGGNGVPIVLVHGLSGNYSRWAPVAELLGNKYRIIDYDLRGHGLSEKGPQIDCGFGAHVEDLAGLMDALGVERAVIAGHSMGGMIAQHFALAYPERVVKLVLCATAACLAPNRILRSIAILFSSLLLAAPGLLVFLTGRKTAGKPRSLFPEKDRPELKPGPLPLVKCFRAILAMDIRKEVAGIRNSSMVICSTRDELVNPRKVKELAGIIPGAIFEEVENDGHYVPVDQPVKVAELITEFVDN